MAVTNIQWACGLPPEVRTWAKPLLEGKQLSQPVRRRLARLASSSDLRHVWKALQKRKTPKLARMLAMLMLDTPEQWGRVRNIQISQVRKKANRIASKAYSLAQSISENEDDLKFIFGSDLEMLKLLEKAGPLMTDHLAWVTFNSEIVEHLKDQNWHPYFPDLPLLLRTFGDLLRSRPADPGMHLRPTKPNAPNARRTYCIRVISHFFRSHLGRPCHELVADTVTVMLGLRNPIDPNLIAKLTRDLP